MHAFLTEKGNLIISPEKPMRSKNGQKIILKRKAKKH